METAAGLVLFLLGAFGLIVMALTIPQIEFYTGGLFILLFIVALFYAWGNAIRQSKKLEQSQPQQEQKEPPH